MRDERILKDVCGEASLSMAEFILETSYLSRRIIHTNNSSKYKSEDEFCSIICLETTAEKKTLRTGTIAKI